MKYQVLSNYTTFSCVIKTGSDAKKQTPEEKVIVHDMFSVDYKEPAPGYAAPSGATFVGQQPLLPPKKVTDGIKILSKDFLKKKATKVAPSSDAHKEEQKYAPTRKLQKSKGDKSTDTTSDSEEQEQEEAEDLMIEEIEDDDKGEKEIQTRSKAKAIIQNPPNESNKGKKKTIRRNGINQFLWS